MLPVWISFWKAQKRPLAISAKVFIRFKYIKILKYHKQRERANVKDRKTRDLVVQLTQFCPLSFDATSLQTVNVSKPLFDFQTHADFNCRRLWPHLAAQPLAFFNVSVKTTRHDITTAQLLYCSPETKEKPSVALWVVSSVTTVNDTICQTVIIEVITEKNNTEF